jgi:hypothetical protein
MQSVILKATSSVAQTSLKALGQSIPGDSGTEGRCHSRIPVVNRLHTDITDVLYYNKYNNEDKKHIKVKH